MVDKTHVKRAVMVSLFVGSVLNIINQGEVILAGEWDALNLTKFFLTYIVPFVVSMYTAIKIEKSR